jgi:chromatin remodeling complex protein RSC6
MAKKKGGAFGGMKIRPDAVLAKVIGGGAVSPAEMTKKLWVYIKKNKLMKK